MLRATINRLLLLSRVDHRRAAESGGLHPRRLVLRRRPGADPPVGPHRPPPVRRPAQPGPSTGISTWTI